MGHSKKKRAKDYVEVNENDENGSDFDVTDDDMIDLNISDDDDDMELNAMAANNDDILSNEEDEEEDEENDWGSRKKVYYEPGESNTGKIDEDEAREEEEEATRLQNKQYSELTSEDYEDIFQNIEEDSKSKSKKHQFNDMQPIIEHIERDLSKLNSAQIKEILSKEVPDLLVYYEKLESILPSYENEFQKVYNKAIHSNIILNEGKQYIKFKQSLILNYLYNIIFYTLLKVEGKDPRIHPITNYLKSIHELVNKVENMDNNSIKDKINEFMNTEEEGSKDSDMNKKNDEKADKVIKSKSKSMKIAQNSSIISEENKQKMKINENNKYNDGDDSNSGESDEEYQYIDKIRESRKRKMEERTIHGNKIEENAGPRKITQEIMKNRGLSTHKNRMHRNPRVTKRLQYEKAIKRRRSAVPDVRTGESGRYGGEFSGIRNDIARSRKLA